VRLRSDSQQNDDVEETDFKNEWYLSHKHEPDWSTLETPQVMSKVANLLKLTRETHATAQQAVNLVRQGKLPAMSRISERPHETMRADVAPDETPQQMSGPTFFNDRAQIGSATPKASSESKRYPMKAENLTSRLASASLPPQVEDQHESESLAEGDTAAELTLPSKKRDSISDSIPQIPPIPPRPAHRRLSVEKENVGSTPSSSPSTSLSSVGSSKRSFRFDLDNAANSWRPSTSKATAGTSFHADNVFKNGGLQGLQSSLKMTPLALPGETVDAAIKRISTLTLPKRPTAEELMKQEYLKTQSPPKMKSQTWRHGDTSVRLPRGANGASLQFDAHPVSPRDTDELASHPKGKQKTTNFDLSISQTNDHVEQSSLSPERPATDDNTVSPSGQSAGKHRRSDAVTMSREESIQCKSVHSFAILYICAHYQ
jgi:hypothetical protein